MERLPLKSPARLRIKSLKKNFYFFLLPALVAVRGKSGGIPDPKGEGWVGINSKKSRQRWPNLPDSEVVGRVNLCYLFLINSFLSHMIN